MALENGSDFAILAKDIKEIDLVGSGMIEKPIHLHGDNYRTDGYNVLMFSSWDEVISSLRSKPYFQELERFWDEVYAKSTVYPKRELIFNAFKQCPLSQTKVVLLGQDPYHEEGQAMGLSFSVPQGVIIPPSLKNIYKEIEQDIGCYMNEHDGDLTYLAKQGVLLLNVNLTVEAHKALSHQKKEYLAFTNDILSILNKLDRPMVYLLLGNFAKGFADKLDHPKQLVLTANHPSPLSANRGGFFGTHLFSTCNQYLEENGVAPIQWGNALF